MQRRKEYRRYVISWLEPPAISAAWVVNVASEGRDLRDKIGKSSAVFSGQTRDDAISNAKAFIDMLQG
jgi:hypothetical protein